MDDDIERLLAEDEASIADDGFAHHTRERLDRRSLWRRGLLFMAGGAGFAIALESLAGFAPMLTKAVPSEPQVSVQISIPGVDQALPLDGGLLLAMGVGACLLLAMAIMEAARD